jgi:hypothetical protein
MPKSIEQIEREECRLRYLQVLYEVGNALSAKSVRRMLDNLGCPLTWENFMRHVEWLVSEGGIRAFPATIERTLNDVEQAKYVKMMKTASFDAPETSLMMLRIRSLGKHHIEGNAVIMGVAKVD